jgi:cobalamin biosynthesis protein CobD/CbiB
MVCGMRNQSPAEWCTQAAAAELLGVSLRQVGRYVADGTLTGQHPICGSRESKRHKVIISLDEVRTLAAARRVVKGDA